MFGELSDFPLPEIFGMLDRYSGRLLLEHLGDGARYELFLLHGHWCGLTVSGRPVWDGVEARHVFMQLVRSSQGSFAFQPQADTQIPRHFDLQLTPLLLKSAVEIDEYQKYHAQLPHPDTRFTLSTTDHSHLPPDLQAFIERAQASLQVGISVSELAQRLALDLPEVQLKLLKLRQNGWIEPQRALPPPAAPPSSKPPGLIARLLNALRGKRPHSETETA